MKQYWKAFRIGELFEKSTVGCLKDPIKDLDHSNSKNEEYCIPVISSSGNNNGISGYVKRDLQKAYNSKTLTIADPGEASGRVFYQENDFLFTYNVRILVNKLNINFSENSYKFIADYISKVFLNKFHGFTRKISAGNDFSREIILLPVIQCSEQDAIWTEDDGTFITLDTDKISEIMEKVEANKRKKTIDLYEASKAKYELEKAKYELEKAKYDEDKEFLEEKKKIYWKSYRVGELFERTSEGSVKTPLKDLDISDEKTEEYNLPLITMSSINDGIGGYLRDADFSNKINSRISLVSGINAGASFFHDYNFVTSGANTLKILNNNLNKLTDKNSMCFIAKSIFRIFKNKMHGWISSTAMSAKDGRARSAGNDFSREIILLPVYDEDSEVKFSTKMMGYLYLLSRIKYWDNKINNYNTKIKELS